MQISLWKMKILDYLKANTNKEKRKAITTTDDLYLKGLERHEAKISFLGELSF